MAEVANLPQAPASEHSSVSATTLAADVPVENIKNEVNDLASGGQPGTSPNHEKSSNSHHHDSEYDTASDLEGGAHGEYDDDDDDDDDGDEEEEDDDDDDDSLEDVGNTDTDSLEFDVERQRGDGQETTDYTKKVDEDRSNPQYIPKKGTFYEHDDRTADEPEGTLSQVTEISEDGEISALSPTISQASKTMKKWQPASGGDRWSHDRFDASEQAPKSRSELVSAYGYDIRNEDGPPRARRRRRYARGPSKYSRNWEDETAYIKASNAQRKPPKPEDFPALEERQKARKSRSYRDEKENRFDRPQADRPRIGGQQTSSNRENKEHVKRPTANTKHFRAGNRQPAMDFKNKSRSSGSAAGSHANSSRGSNNIEKDFNIVRSIVNQPAEANVEAHNFQKLSNNKSINVQPTLKTINQQPYNGYDHGQPIHASPQSVSISNSGGYSSREISEKFSNSHSGHSRQTSSNLSARLQQAQNRNDPSHVGSVQMHTLANQHNSQGGNQNALQNNMLDLQPKAQQPTQQVVNQQEHARTKRYSSLRQRSQHDTTSAVPSSNQHLDQHALQQLHMQHEVQQQQQIATTVHTPQQIMLQEQHLIQANLMQLYHQENLQAQMQALQVSGLPQTSASQQPAAVKQPFAGIPQQYSAASAGPPAAAYYTPTAPDYSSPPPAAGPPQNQYPQQPTAFLQTQSASAPLAFNPTASQPLSQAALAPSIAAPASATVPPGTVNYVQSASQNPSATPSAAYPNYTNYQNFNTVGGTTYFVPSPQPTARPVVLPQRRPTNAIPILPPSEKTKRNQENKEDDSKNNSTSGSTPSVSSTSSANAPIGSAENIDHILDNMFVQRPPYQPQTRKSSSPPNDDSNKSSTTSSIGAAAVQADPAKSRTHDSSAKSPLQDIEPSIIKQSAVPAAGTANAIAMTTSTANADSGSTLAEAPLSESVPQ